jgi:hypothetical protein
MSDRILERYLPDPRALSLLQRAERGLLPPLLRPGEIAELWHPQDPEKRRDLESAIKHAIELGDLSAEERRFPPADSGFESYVVWYLVSGEALRAWLQCMSAWPVPGDVPLARWWPAGRPQTWREAARNFAVGHWSAEAEQARSARDFSSTNRIAEDVQAFLIEERIEAPSVRTLRAYLAAVRRELQIPKHRGGRPRTA